VEIFARYFEHSAGRLDILVNNACQTVRRPPEFYAHLLEGESGSVSDLPVEVRGLLASHERLKGALDGGRALPPAASDGGTGLLAWHGGRGGIGITESAELSQVRYTYDDAAQRGDLFPTGRVDADLQQVDLRHRNTGGWPWPRCTPRRCSRSCS
jgi:hypothetical protein